MNIHNLDELLADFAKISDSGERMLFVREFYQLFNMLSEAEKAKIEQNAQALMQALSQKNRELLANLKSVKNV